MKAHECYHCKQWVEDGEAHDCWTTTEAALTDDLPEELQDAYERIREAAVDLGEQRIYASHSSIMFSRKACHFFVRPRRGFLELWIFLGRTVRAPQIRKVVESSSVKRAHLLHIRHRDEIGAPITDWMREAFQLENQLTSLRTVDPARAKPRRVKPRKPTATTRGPVKKVKGRPQRRRAAPESRRR